MANEKSIVLTSSNRKIIEAAIALHYDQLKRIGYNPDLMIHGTYPEEIVPLSRKLKFDVLDLHNQEALLLRELLLEYCEHLEVSLDNALAPEEYTTKVRALLEEVNILLEQIS